MTGFTLHIRLRVQTAVVLKAVEWHPEKAAVIICDMWDTHHCVSAAQRVVEMAPYMNEVVTRIREKGALIIHAPSS